MYIAHLVLFPLSSIAPRTLQGYHMFRKAHYLCILHFSTASNNREIDNRCRSESDSTVWSVRSREQMMENFSSYPYSTQRIIHNGINHNQ